MARPRKSPTEKRDRKVVVWMSAAEQARFLINATRVGLTSPDYVRAIACGGEFKAATDIDAPERIVLKPSQRELQQLLARAGTAGLALDRFVIAAALAEAGAAPASDFELVDALVRHGTTLQRLTAIASTTGIVPDEVREVLAKIERLLDRMLA